MFVHNLSKAEGKKMKENWLDSSCQAKQEINVSSRSILSKIRSVKTHTYKLVQAHCFRFIRTILSFPAELVRFDSWLSFLVSRRKARSNRKWRLTLTLTNWTDARTSIQRMLQILYTSFFFQLLFLVFKLYV